VRARNNYVNTKILMICRQVGTVENIQNDGSPNDVLGFCLFTGAGPTLPLVVSRTKRRTSCYHFPTLWYCWK
jgi:hypothetical protein